jgi:hypothetical protein
MNQPIEKRQRHVCRSYGAGFSPPAPGSKLGVARDAATDLQPLNGLRHPPEGDTCGWYLWRGDVLSQAEDYFQPMHVEHLATKCPQALDFLALPPGWRFLLAPDQLEVWYDESLLRVD